MSTQVASVIYIFFTQFNNNSNKKNCQTHGFNPTRPDSTKPVWVGLDLCDRLGSPWWVRSKNSLNPTQPDPCTPLNWECCWDEGLRQPLFLLSFLVNWDSVVCFRVGLGLIFEGETKHRHSPTHHNLDH